MDQHQSNPSTSILSANNGLLLLFSVAFIFTFSPVWKRLITVWYSSDDYSHGFFIIPICIYMLWHKKEFLAKTEIQQSPFGLAVILTALLLYLLANFAEIITLASLSMVLFIAGTVLYLFGFEMLKEMLFPIFLLLFMIPIPEQIYTTLTVPLQLFVTKSSTWLGSILGMPIYREGNVIHLPEHTLQVVQACSGLRSLLSLLTLSAVFSYFTLKSNILRMILIFLGIPAAIVVNIFRVLIMMFVFHYFNYDLTEGTAHTVLGIVIFIFALLIIAIMRKVLLFWDKLAIKK